MSTRPPRPMDHPVGETPLREFAVEDAVEMDAGTAGEELREFLEADTAAGQGDPLFRERLRRRLWTMLREQRRRD